MDNLIAIENCKNDIKSALINKGVDMTDVAFSGYAEKINAMQLESGDSPAPTPSADYIYSNGYVEGGEPNEIINLIPHEIQLDEKGKCSFELICPIEIAVYNYENFDIIFTVDIPEKYKISENGFEVLGLTDYEPYPYGYKANPRHEKIVRGGVTYNSFVRCVADGVDYDSGDVSSGILKYRITIESV